MTYVIKCPNCDDVFEAKEDYKKCKCFRCGFEYKPTKTYISDWIWQAMQRVKGG